jgi:hypothetical protein
MLKALALTFLTTASASASAEDVAAGGELHRENCESCHGSLMNGDADQMYLRENRFVQSYPSLLTQVRRCEVNLSLQWFDEDVHNVSAFLNQQFYKLPR